MSDKEVAQDREEIVSSLISMSETLCEKALQLSEGTNPSDLMKRGKALQKKAKKGKTKGSRLSTGTSRNDIQISCCLMEMVERKISDVVGLSETDEEKVLLTCRGLVINPNLGDNNPWDIGSYLNKKHIAPEKLTLGVGLVASSDVAGSPPPLHRKNSRKRQRAPSLCPPTVKCPKQSTCNDKIQVYYSEPNSVVPMTREEVWSEVNPAGCGHGSMDKHSIFLPEYEGYRVLRLQLFNNGNRISILHANSSGMVTSSADTIFEADGIICFQSDPQPKVTSFRPILLCVVGSNHPYCSYKWEYVSNRNMDFPSTPVLFVSNADLFKCSVISSRNVMGSVHFDVIQDVSVCVDLSEDHDDGGGHVLYERTTVCETIAIQAPSAQSLEFTTEELMKATNQLDKENEIGKGGYGRVFIARDLRSKGTTAAIKVLNKDGGDALLRTSASKQIDVELKSLMRFRHPNILDVMGFCFSQTLKALVYTYMHNGSLHQWLHMEEHTPLDWISRKRILTDMFRGVAYLHAGNPPLIYQDIKSHNILIDSNKNGVVGDFGFALELPRTVSGRTLITAPLIARTEGYFAPEITSGKLSPLSDVYSCGVVVLEAYTSQRAYSYDRADNDLASHTEDQRAEKDTFLTLADPRAPEAVDETLCEIFRTVVNKCLSRYSKRPNAGEVLAPWQ